MWFFKKKKVKPPVLDSGLLAEAISIKTDIFGKTYYRYFNHSIKIDDNIVIDIENVRTGHPYKKYYEMDVSICIENILIVTFKFHLQEYCDMDNYRRWDCRHSEYKHEIPYSVIDKLNDWSKNIVDKFTKTAEITRKVNEMIEVERVKEEQEILKKYW